MTAIFHSLIMRLVERKAKWRTRWIGQSVINYWRPVWLTWHKYLGLTTIPGLQSVYNAQGKFFTFVWSVLFAIGLACTIRDVYVGCLDYLAYPVTTAMNLKQAASLPFPAVTVCNLNRVHCGNLRGLVRQNRGTDLGEQLKRFEEIHFTTHGAIDYHRLYEVTSCADVRRIPRSSYQDYENYGENTNEYLKVKSNCNYPGKGKISIDSDCECDKNNVCQTNYNDGISLGRKTFGSTVSRISRKILAKATTESPPGLTSPTSIGGDEEDGSPTISQTQSFNDLMNFMALYANFSEENRIAMGHDAAGFIRACTFSGKSCSNVTLFFKTLPTTSYGNCFTFDTTRKTVMPGRDYGLSMELYLDQSNYIGGGLSPRAGARVVVHPPSQLPLPNENGLTVPPHTATSAALVQVQVAREKLPYVTNCTSEWERTWYEARVGGSYKYSMERCQRVCLQLAFEDVCSCTHPSYMDVFTEASPCNLTSENQDYTCVGRVLEEFETRARECSCNMDCREITYDMKISQAAWPNDNNWCEVAQRFGIAKACRFEGYRSDYRVREKQLLLQNVLTIDVFFENLRVQSIDQHPTYKLQSFVGSLGGALSLYLGVTLFMLLEVLEVFVRLIFALFHRGCCFIYQRGFTATRNRSHRRTVAQQGIFYTDLTGECSFLTPLNLTSLRNLCGNLEFQGRLSKHLYKINEKFARYKEYIELSNFPNSLL